MMTTVVNEIKMAMMQTFEKLAFMEVSYTKQLTSDSFFKKSKLKSIYTSSIDLKTPKKGTLMISMPANLIDIIASIIYNDVKQSSTPVSISGTNQNEHAENSSNTLKIQHKHETLLDILNEILNTLAGNFLSLVIPNEKVFSIGFPKTSLSLPDDLILTQTENWTFCQLQEKFTCAVYVDFK